MRMPIVITALCLGMLLCAPAQAGGKSYGHHKKHYHGHFQHHGHDDDTFLAAVGIIAGAHLIDSYLHRPRYPPPAAVYAPPVYAPQVYAIPVQPRQCFQTYVPYANPYGGVFWVPQLQCY